IVMVPHDLGEGPEPLLMRVEPAGAEGHVHLYWNAVEGAHAYDAIVGNVESLKSIGDRITLGSVSVPGRLLAVPSWSDADVTTSGETTVDIPASGKAFFYLVQYRTDHGSSGFGTESVPLPREPSYC